MIKLHPETHLDHGLTAAQLSHILLKYGSDGCRDSIVAQLETKGVFIETFELPDELGIVACGLYGPIMGDKPILDAEVTYRVRPGRSHVSRLISRPMRPTRLVTMIAGPHANEPCILYTVFGGPIAPKEPNDPTLKADERAKSDAFWGDHALADGKDKLILQSIVDKQLADQIDTPLESSSMVACDRVANHPDSHNCIDAESKSKGSHIGWHYMNPANMCASCACYWHLSCARNFALGVVR